MPSIVWNSTSSIMPMIDTNQAFWGLDEVLMQSGLRGRSRQERDCAEALLSELFSMRSNVINVNLPRDRSLVVGSSFASSAANLCCSSPAPAHGDPCTYLKVHYVISDSRLTAPSDIINIFPHAAHTVSSRGSEAFPMV